MGYFMLCGIDGSLHAAPPELTKPPIARLSMGSTIFSFNASLDASTHSPSLLLSARDELTSECISEYALEPKLNIPYENEVTALIWQCKFCRDSRFNLADIVELNGVGRRYSGNAFVSSVCQFVEEGKWTTTVGFGLEPKLNG